MEAERIIVWGSEARQAGFQEALCHFSISTTLSPVTAVAVINKEVWGTALLFPLRSRSRTLGCISS